MKNILKLSLLVVSFNMYAMKLPYIEAEKPNEVVYNQATESASSVSSKNRSFFKSKKFLAFTIAAAGLGTAGYYAYQNPEAFKEFFKDKDIFRKFDFSIFSRAKAQVENIPAPVDTAAAGKLMQNMSSTMVSYYNSAVEAGSKGLDHLKWFLNK